MKAKNAERIVTGPRGGQKDKSIPHTPRPTQGPSKNPAPLQSGNFVSKKPSVITPNTKTYHGADVPPKGGMK